MIETTRVDSRFDALAAALARRASLSPGLRLERLVREGELELPFPGHGETRLRFAMLQLLGRGDLSLARLAEGHLDALAILDEAGVAAPEGALGVWAAGPVDSLRAVRTREGWRLEGIRRWCSGAPDLAHALVRADAAEGELLFCVPLTLPGLRPVAGSWPAVGMAASSTLDVRFENVELADHAAIGPPGFYLQRPGFWFGAAGVAAVWFGGAEAVAATVAGSADSDPHRLAHLGWIASRLAALDALLSTTAELIDSRPDGPLLIEQAAQVLRAEVASGAAEILDRAGRATGAGPLCHDADHARRVADLTVYIRQGHAEADLERIGRLELQRRKRSGRA